MEMPKIEEAHTRLKLFEGFWQGDEQIHTSPMDPHGGKAIGRVKNKIGLNGFVVIQNYVQERDGHINFEGHGILWWDDSNNVFVFHWFDTFGMPPNIFKGQFEGDVLTLISDTEEGILRSIYDFRRRGVYNNTMDISKDGETWHPFMDGVYHKLD